MLGPGTLKQHSPNVWEYQPQAVLADSSGGLGVYSGERLRKILADDPEAKILFYDVFRSGDGKNLIGIQAGEFVDNFGEVRFRHAGRALKSRYSKEGKLKLKNGGFFNYFVRWQIEVPNSADESVDLEIECEGAPARLNVPPYPFRSWRKAKLVQQTVQKDYPFVWIRDHCLFHHRVHGFDRVVIYDNGSANYAELLNELVKMEERDLQILVVNWPFAMFRPSIMSQIEDIHDTLSQRAAFNHGLQMLRRLSSYGTNLDLDEYLYIRSGVPLSKLIAQKTRIVPSRTIRQYRVPNVPDVGSRYPVRAAQFKYSYINPPRSSKSPKYMYRMGATLLGSRVALLDVHWVGRVHENKLSREVQLLLRKLVISKRTLVNRFKRFRANRSARRAGAQPISNLPRSSHPIPQTPPRVPSQEYASALIYHYEGINTMWKRDLTQPLGLKHDDTEPLEFNPAVHVKDLSVYKLLSAVGLTD